MRGNFGAHQPHGMRAKQERALLFLAVSIAFAIVLILVGLLNFKTTAAVQTEEVPIVQPLAANVGTVTLYTPMDTVRAGMSLAEVQWKEVYWPRNQVPDGAIRDKAQFNKMYARIDIPAGTAVQTTHVTEAKMSFELPLTPGNRAVSIEVDDITGLEGHAGPGTRVDVVLTHHVEGKLTSQVIVQNARVISYGGDTRSVAEKRMLLDKSHSRRSSKTLTLDVAPQDALKITTARQLGRLSLMMRAPEDLSAAPSVEVNENLISDTSQLANQDGKQGVCNSGVIKMGGQEYVVGCDGKIVSQVQ